MDKKSFKLWRQMGKKKCMIYKQFCKIPFRLLINEIIFIINIVLLLFTRADVCLKERMVLQCSVWYFTKVMSVVDQTVQRNQAVW